MNASVNKRFFPILVILLVATGLRFYNIGEMPFTHDEFSTIFRLNFDSLHEVIEIGMKELDNHPIGTQVFYYYYTKVFGTGELAVKFPIILFGIFSVFLVYVLGKRWFNSTSALYAAAFMAVLQYTVAQSITARMYGFGIPFVLLMVLYWDKIISNSFTLKNAIAYVLFASVCAYNHYFSLLFVSIVWVSGLFFIRKANVVKYIIAGFSIFLLFVPHLGIFFYQLSKGGIEGWLGKLSLSFYSGYIFYIYHHSWFVALAALLPIGLLFNKKVENTHYRKISLIWFIVPIIIGSIYSYFVSNLLHERVLYFSFPFLLLFLASFIKQTTYKNELLLVSIILIVGSLSLIFERQHFRFYKEQRYKLVAQMHHVWKNDVPDGDLLTVKFTEKKIDNYYTKKYGESGNNIIYGDSIKTLNGFIKVLQKTKADYLYFGRARIVDPTYLQIALEYYPKILKRRYTIAGESYLLKKDSTINQWPCAFIKYKKPLNIDTTNATYIGTVEALVDTLIFSEFNLLSISAKIKALDTIGGAKIVSSIEKDGDVIDWRSSEVNEFIVDDSAFNEAMLTVSFPGIHLKKNASIKFFIWNPNNADYSVQSMEWAVRPGNPFIWASTEAIPWRLEPFCLKMFNK